MPYTYKVRLGSDSFEVWTVEANNTTDYDIYEAFQGSLAEADEGNEDWDWTGSAFNIQYLQMDGTWLDEGVGYMTWMMVQTDGDLSICFDRDQDGLCMEGGTDWVRWDMFPDDGTFWPTYP